MSAATRTVTTREPARTLRTMDLLILSIGTFTLGVDGFVLSGLLPQVASSLHVSVSTIGQLTTQFALVYALGSPLIAALTSSRDRRTLLATGMSVYVAGILSDDEHRARSLAIVAAGSSVALVAGLPFGVLVGQTWGWRAAMWALVVLAALSTVAVRFLPAAHVLKLGLRRRAGALTDRRVLAVLAGTLTVLTPAFAVIAYLPAIMQTSGLWIVVAILGYGAGQVTGTAVVPRLIQRRGARTALLAGAGGVTAATAVLTVTRTVDIAAVVTMSVLGLAVGLAIVPQQVRLFATVPKLAPIAVGLNESVIYTGSALGAAVGGLTLATAGPAAPAIAAAAIGLLGVIVAATVVPERIRASRHESTSCCQLRPNTHPDIEGQHRECL